MSNTKSKIYNKIVTILDKFSNRLVRIADQTKGNSDAIVRLTSGQQTLQDNISRVEFENNKREEAQVLRDQSNVQSLVNLRDSTKKAFDQVAADVKTLLTATQRLNERVGQVESRQSGPNPFGVDITVFREQLKDFESRLTSRGFTDDLPSGHVWVNKKLSGVYAVADEFEARIQKLEAGSPVISVSEQSNIVNRNRARVITSDGLCTDTLCKQQVFNGHYFGPGCRFYESGR
jgi:hypothetical protein